MAQIKPTMKSFGQALAGQKIKSTYIKPSAFTSSTAVMNAPGMTSSGAYSAVELNELSSIKKNLTALVAIEKKYNDFLGDKIIKFARSEERTKLKKRESSQESKGRREKKAKDNPVVKGAMRGLDGLIGFFGDLFKWFIGYKIVEWVSKPENTKKLKDFAKLFLGIFKFVSNVVGFGIDKLMSGLSHLVDGGGITRVFGALEMIVGFFTLKWLLNPTKIISDIKMIGNVFTKIIPSAINGVLNFFTNLIPTAATQAVDTAVNEGLKGAADAGKEAAKQAAGQATEQAAKSGGKAAAQAGGKAAAKGAGAAATKGAAKGAGKSLMKKLPVLGAIAGGVFAVDRASKGDWLGAGMEVASGAAALLPGWGTAASIGIDAALVARDIAKEKEKEDKKLPKLAKGGIVTKPTKAIVGEAGPEAILPLEKLSAFTGKGLETDVSKIIPKFMKMLTIPFTLVGAGIVALMSSSLSMIPGIGPLMVPLISSIASTFGIPTSIIKGVSKFTKNPVETIKQGASNIAKIFGEASPKITKQAGNKFTPSNDTSVRGLLGNILGALVSKNSGQTTTPASTPPGASGGSPTGSTPSSGQNKIDTNTGAQLTGTGSPIKNTEFAKTQLESTKPKFGEGKASQTLQDIGNKNLQKVTGDNPGKYFYDAYGNVYAVDKDERRILTPADFKAGVGGNAGALYFFRNLNTGTVSISRHADAQQEGWYDYAANAVKEMQSGSRAGIIWIPISESKKYKSGFSEATPYGKTTLKAQNGRYIPGNTSIDGDRVPVLAEPGEYMFNKNAVAKMGGPKVLDKLNYDMFPRFAKWGGDILKMASGGTVIEYITGDKSHPAYASDHGGGNYHDHLAFKSRAERDAAIKHLESKGWFVGSKNDGRHASGSYHYSNQAFDIPFYPNQSRKGVTDNQTGETRLSSMLRADLAAGGFKVPGGRGPGGLRENDNIKNTQSQEEQEPDWGSVIKDLSSLYKGLTGTPSASIPEAPTLPPPKPTASIPQSSTKLQQAQKISNQNKAVAQKLASAKPSGGNVVSVSQGTNVINQSTMETLAPALGNTIPPLPLTIFPATP